MTYHRDLDNQHNAIYAYDYTNKKNHTVTSGFYDAFNPVFDPKENIYTSSPINPSNPTTVILTIHLFIPTPRRSLLSP
jgi:tricorn protease